MSRARLLACSIAVSVAIAFVVAAASPAGAVRAVKRALNANAVDGLSASKKPQRGKLLALDSKARFPRSVLANGVRGPRGAQGPAGATGASGPSGPAGPAGAAEAYIARNNAAITIPTAGTTTVAELRVPAGSYAIDFAAHAFNSAAVTTFVDCQLTTNGQQIVKTATHIGNVAGAALEAPLSMIEAVTLAESTLIRALCSERSDTAVRLVDARLRASRVTTVVVP